MKIVGPIWRKYLEAACLIVLLSLGLGLRLVFTHKFPSIPVSDFRSLVYFGQVLQQHGIISNGWFWEYLNPGLPLILCGLFHLFPLAGADNLARGATAVFCGLLPIVPFLIWRGIFPLWLRFAAGASLALWPGQILFSGVVAQDNWIVLPTVALGALAVRAYKGGRAAPVIAALLLAGTVAIRQEMLLPLTPLFLVAANGPGRPRWRSLAIASLSAALLLFACAAYRKACTGHLSLTTEHAGLSMLGSYVPGAASTTGWIDPFPFIASVRPDLLSDREALLSKTPGLAVQQFLLRPVFHTTRIVASVFTNAVEGEHDSLTWALSPAVLPPNRGPYGPGIITRMDLPLRWEMAVIQGLFLVLTLAAIRRRLLIVPVLALAVALKYGIHALTVSQGRYFLAATALEIITIWVAVYELKPPTWRKPALLNAAILLLAAGLLSGALILLTPRIQEIVRLHDLAPQRTYQFPLALHDHSASLSCVMKQGFLTSLTLSTVSAQSATIQTFHKDPTPGESATAECELSVSGPPGPLALQVLDSYAPGGSAGRMLQRVTLDGTEVFHHDIAGEPGSGWASIPLAPGGVGTKRRLTIQVQAMRPDPGWDWGDAAATTFQLVRLN